ncbi:MAG: tyrosine-type recombinase/integrase [Elusimicrobia bacterium]|nr:tyrosine-type recombinase/integrase [Elusimicrobiota bacterium]
MLFNTISDFLSYGKTYGFSSRSLEVFASMLKKFAEHLQSFKIRSIREITYKHLLSFVISGNPSAHIKKHRIWSLRQFFQYLKNKKIIKENIAIKIPYPQINKKEPDSLTFKELKIIINYFISSTDSPTGMRNFIIVLFLIFMGLRITSILNICIQDIDLITSSLLVTEKGNRKRIIFLPQILCSFLYLYIKSLKRNLGPLFLSQQNKKISHRTVQHLFSQASGVLGIHICSRMFRHTAATHLNKIAGLDVTKFVLGHRRRESTKRYVHLNPDVYAEYMKRHPYMNLNFKENTNE